MAKQGAEATRGFGSGIRKKAIMTGNVTQYWKRLFTEAVDSPSLEAFKTPGQRHSGPDPVLETLLLLQAGM